MDAILALFDATQQFAFEHLLLPLMLALGLDNRLEDAYVGAWWLVGGAVQIGVLLALIRPLERWRPVEPPPADSAQRVARRRAVRPDVIYTLIHRLGVFRAVLFLTLVPLWDQLIGWLRLQGVSTWHLDAAIAPWVPGVTDSAWFAFLVYLVVFDALGWLIHWTQHHVGWWWQLHALHHSQQHLTLWSDNRNHLLDDVLHDGILVMAGLLIGVAPAQFVAVVLVSQLMENLAHANVRLDFGPILGRLLVGPSFHRAHHRIEPAELPPGSPMPGINYGVLFPWWDQLARTVDYRSRWEPTGLRDGLSGQRDYGQGVWAQQWLGLRRLVGRR